MSAVEQLAHLYTGAEERDLFRGFFRASEILEEHPRDQLARSVLAIAAELDPDDFSLRDNRVFMSAIKAVISTFGTAYPTLVAQELRRARRWELMQQLLPEAVHGFTSGPLRSIPALVEFVRTAAFARREWVAMKERQAEIAAGSL